MKSPFNNPDLMVVGDSLAQGCRSLTVCAPFCAQSYPALVARLAGWSLAAPDMKRPVLFNVEDVARYPIFDALVDLLGAVGANYDAWRHGFAAGQSNSESGAVFFDNLAVAGSTLAELVGGGHGTAAAADDFIGQVPNLNLLSPAVQHAIGDLHVAVNARFTLNPSNAPEYQGLSQLDWVIARQPKALIFHAGHNDGLYKIGSEGDDGDWRANWGPGGQSLGHYFAALDRLAAQAPNTRVMVLGLPKVGAVANVMPVGPDRLAGNPAYFAAYTTVFPGRTAVSGDRMAAADGAIAGVNAQLAAKVAALRAAGGRFEFFDVYGFFNRFDAKNLPATATPIVVEDKAIKNTYLAGKSVWVQGPGGRIPHFEIEFGSGGLQSIDGMHPTAVGYALLATELANVFAPGAVTDDVRAATLKAAFDGDALLTNFPPGLCLLIDVANRFAAQASKSDAEAKLGAALAGISQAMH